MFVMHVNRNCNVKKGSFHMRTEILNLHLQNNSCAAYFFNKSHPNEFMNYVANLVHTFTVYDNPVAAGRQE